MYRLVTIISIILCSYSSYSQKKVYFLINESDSLINKRISETPNSYAGYRIFYDKKVRVRKNNTPLQIKSESAEKIKVWVEDAKYDYYVYEKPSVSFSFIKEFDELIDKKELEDWDIITDRRDFLKISDNAGFDGQGNTYYFLEQRKDDKYLMRKVYPVVYE